MAFDNEHFLLDAGFTVVGTTDRVSDAVEVIASGKAIDLVLVDLTLSQEVRNEHQLTKCGWSPWHGETLTGWPVRTLVHGRTVWCEGQLDERVCGREIEFDRGD